MEATSKISLTKWHSFSWTKKMTAQHAVDNGTREGMCAPWTVYCQDENLLKIEDVSNVRRGESVLLAVLVCYWVWERTCIAHNGCSPK